jgi:N-acetylmuramoyl-L-alanine amidase
VQAVPFSLRTHAALRSWPRGFGMLLHVTNSEGNSSRRTGAAALFRYALLSFALVLIAALAVSHSTSAKAPAQNPPSSSAPTAVTPQSNSAPSNAPMTSQSTPPPQRPGLNIVVLDPAHGGTDTGARGTGGIHESDVVLQFAAQVRRALEAQGFQVVQTRLANENPSFDDRSAIANAQTGAVFVSLHISSTGPLGTVRVYLNSDLPAARASNGLIPWDRAQAPFLSLSHKLADIVQGNLTQTFRGSPGDAQAAAIRQLRTTAAPAIAVEISSVSVNERADLDRMAPGVADAIARGVATFRPSYVVASMSGEMR